MPNILDDEFKISKYLYSDDNDIINTAINKAKKWSIDYNRIIITPDESSLDNLEDSWILFNSMIKKHRRESDWKAIELFGATNQDIYEYLKSKFLKEDIDDNKDEYLYINNLNKTIKESYIDSTESYYDINCLSYSSEDVEKAKQWASYSNRIIILPTRTLNELEELWDNYNSMIKKHRRESDWFSLEVFGVTNLKHYEFLKNEFLKDDIRKEDKENYGSIIESVTLEKKKKYLEEVSKESRIDLAKCLINMELSINNQYEEAIVSNIVSDVLDKYDSDVIDPSDIIDSINYGDLPYFSPEEMIDMGVYNSNPEDNYFGEISNNLTLNNKISVKEWFELYKLADKGLYTEFSRYSSDWIDSIKRISHEISILEKNNTSKKEINSKKQSLLELGWDPDIKISPISRKLSTESAKNRMKSNYSGLLYKIINLQEYRIVNADSILTENKSELLKPVYVIMIEDKSSYISKAIKFITKNIYSHIAISLDPELHDMYSYGISTNKHSNKKGFRKEDIDDLSAGSRIGVFAFFLKDNDYNKIVSFINKFKNNAEKTDYSFINLITYLFDIPYNTEWKLICSQFVDRCLQSAGVFITEKDPSQVSQADLYKSMIDNKYIYDLYEGSNLKYDSKQIENLINSLIKKTKPLKENFDRYLSNEKKYILGLLENALNIESLFELQNNLDLIKNQRAKNIISKIIINPININPIEESVINNKSKNNIIKLITKYMKPII